MLDVPRLRLLRAVVAAGSIRAGAAALGYTPSAVSQQLALLQRETGLTLLERVGRGIEPTAAGQVLAAESEVLFAALGRIESVVKDLRAGRMGSLSIGYFASAGAAWLPPIVAALQHEFPELRLELRMTEVERMRPGYTAPDIDVFVQGPGTADPDDAEIIRLTADPYLAVIPAGHRLDGADEVALADLAAERWVDNDVHDGACRRVLLDACAEAGFAPQFAVETHDYPTAVRFVATGVGITVLPSLGLHHLPPGLSVVPVVDPTPVRQISVAIKKAITTHPAARRVRDLLTTAVTGVGATPVPPSAVGSSTV
ncbi:LysR family transcriptional regulator [Phytoactinopolyspora limicola]|uniref:LysR family transcriptional regulator n=1 Tax=Phytoactinopolyspora limicola TaxID=2715536 RepID=UPI0014085861|nr:LysR family transcriptional regulator [Phytoactinopolyspora limicola]